MRVGRAQLRANHVAPNLKRVGVDRPLVGLSPLGFKRSDNPKEIMGLSEFYESTIIKAKASFGFSEFDCDPEEITDALDIKPDQTTRKGEKWIAGSGKAGTRTFNSWRITSKSLSKDINIHLRELLDRLGGKYKLAKSEWGKAAFGITWKNNYLYAGAGPFFEADVLRGIAEWNADLYQDIYYIEEEVNESESSQGLRRLSKGELKRVLKKPSRSKRR